MGAQAGGLRFKHLRSLWCVPCSNPFTFLSFVADSTMAQFLKLLAFFALVQLGAAGNMSNGTAPAAAPAAAPAPAAGNSSGAPAPATAPATKAASDAYGPNPMNVASFVVFSIGAV